jgi:predicted hydrocarbon binding protein
MRFIKMSQKECMEIRKLYESVMSQACHGLFFREGMILGEEMSRIAQQEQGKYFEACSKLLKAKGWVEDVKFEDSVCYITASIESLEVEGAEKPTCHRLRGIVKKIYEGYDHKRKICVEVECAGKGDKQCVFKIEEDGGD